MPPIRRPLFSTFPDEVSLRRVTFYAADPAASAQQDCCCSNGFVHAEAAVKNCYPSKNTGALAAQNASADSDGTSSRQSVLTVVNNSRS